MEWIKPRRFFFGLMVLTLGAALGLAALSILFGELNQDEGWYLYGARLLHEGKIPWRDFGFSQGPVYLAVYALFYPLIDFGGLLAGRVLTAVFGWGAFAFAACLAYALSPDKFKKEGALLALLIGAVGVAQNYYFAIPKTYSLCALWMTGGLLFWAQAVMPKRGPRARTMLLVFSGLFLALATGTRMSAFAMALAPLGHLWTGRVGYKRAYLVFALAYIGGLLLCFLPPLFTGGEAFRFWYWTYHTSRLVEGKVLLKASFISQVAAYWLLPCAVVVVTGLWHFMDRHRTKPFLLPAGAEGRTRHAVLTWVWVGIGAVTAVHLASPFSYPDYQAFLVPVFAAGAAVLALRLLEARMLRDEPVLQFLLGATWLLAMALSFSSPLNRDWFLAGRDLIWWRTKPHGALMELRQVGRQLKNLGPKGATLFTQDAYLAVESGLKLPPGLEMGPFSYNPKWTSEQATKLHGVNREGMFEALRGAEVAAVSGYGFAIEMPQIIPTPLVDRQAFAEELERRYQRVALVPYFGQGNTLLTLWVKR